MPLLIAIALGLWWFGVWPFDGTLFSRFTWRPEIGFYENGAQVYRVGADYESREACTSAALNEFNTMNWHSPNRAFSWACLKTDGDGNFVERVR